MNGVRNNAEKLAGYVMQFRNKYSILTLGVLATIFTWGFVQGTKKYLLSPVIRKHIVRDQTDDDPYYRVNMHAWVAELIEWIVLMSVVLILHYFLGRDNSASSS